MESLVLTRITCYLPSTQSTGSVTLHSVSTNHGMNGSRIPLGLLYSLDVTSQYLKPNFSPNHFRLNLIYFTSHIKLLKTVYKRHTLLVRASPISCKNSGVFLRGVILGISMCRLKKGISRRKKVFQCLYLRM